MKTMFERMEEIPRSVWVVAAVVLLGMGIGFALFSAQTDLRQLERLEAEVKKTRPSVSEARRAIAQLDRTHRLVSEIEGWGHTRLAVGECLHDAAKFRPTELNWSRVVLQQTLKDGSKEPHLAYRPRTRSARIVLSGNAESKAADLLVRTYLETINQSNQLGSAFGKLSYSGLIENPDHGVTQPTYSYTMEGYTSSRRIDRSSPP